MRDFSIDPNLEKLATDTIRMLAADAVQKANSGHPGMPMGAADMAFVLWTRFLRFDPADPNWAGRDRFLLSAGHGSMLQYALLHLFGYDLPLNELKNFRQLGSKTPGHPEYGHTPGVEVTTGPLGQGFANGVGMALAAKITEARFAKDGFCPAGTRIFGIVSDGDLMEGISYESAALAGHLGLGNIVYLYDSNDITIEGGTNLAWSENVPKRFEAAGWHTLTVDGHDHEAIADAIQAAVETTDKPSLIQCRTHIAFGSPNKQDTSDSHGAPLGPEEILATRKALGWPEDADFFVPQKVAELFRDCAKAATTTHATWGRQIAKWRADNPETATAWDRWTSKELPADLLDTLMSGLPDKDDATRNNSGAVLQKAAEILPNLIGGSADLSPSNKTDIKGQPSIVPGDFSGRNLHFGIREHAMGAIANGMFLYGGLRPYVGTFLVFADYMRPTIRMAALMKLPVIFVFTHDSFWVGEDGPTHQPIEQISSLRVIPNTVLLRPADGTETAIAWDLALSRTDGPTVIVLTRQKLARIDRPENFDLDLVKKGAYVVSDSAGNPHPNILIATGSEVATCLEAKKILLEKGIDVRVVSMLSQELFEQQPIDFSNQVLPPDAQNVFYVEASKEPACARYLKGKGVAIGMTGFGSSAPGKVLSDHFGFTPEKVAQTIYDKLSGQ